MKNTLLHQTLKGEIESAVSHGLTPPPLQESYSNCWAKLP